MAKRGARSKLTPETIAKVEQAIRLGATYKLAAYYAGISESHFYEYMKNSDFSDAVKNAEGMAAVQWLAKIEKEASDGNWQAAAWKLERRYPEQYGRTVVDRRIKDLSKLSDDELEALAKGKTP